MVWLAFKQGTKSRHGADRSTACELPDREFQIHKRYGNEYERYEVLEQESERSLGELLALKTEKCASRSYWYQEGSSTGLGTQIAETPNVAKADRVANAGKNEFEFVSPLSAVGVVRVGARARVGVAGASAVENIDIVIELSVRLELIQRVDAITSRI